MCEKPDMAQIPYIEHKKRLFKAYQRERRLLKIAIFSNLFWLLLFCWMIMR